MERRRWKKQAVAKGHWPHIFDCPLTFVNRNSYLCAVFVPRRWRNTKTKLYKKTLQSRHYSSLSESRKFKGIEGNATKRSVMLADVLLAPSLLVRARVWVWHISHRRGLFDVAYPIPMAMREPRKRVSDRDLGSSRLFLCPILHKGQCRNQESNANAVFLPIPHLAKRKKYTTSPCDQKLNDTEPKHTFIVTHT